MARALDQLVLVDALTVEYPRYLEEAVRLLRPGGVVALDNVLWTGRVTDTARREAISSALRETVRAVRADERLAPLLLPMSDGLLCASPEVTPSNLAECGEERGRRLVSCRRPRPC